MPRISNASPQKVAEVVTKPVNASLSMVALVLPYAVLVAVVFWIVYAAKYSEFGPQQDGKGRTNQERFNMAFQAIVATFIVYFLFR